MQCLNDDSLGPAVQGCRGDFDFTITFETLVLTVVPAGVFVVLGIARLVSLRHARAIVNCQRLGLLKLVRTFKQPGQS